MSQTQNYFFTIEFYVGDEFGMAIVISDNNRSAITHLRNSGKYNATPEVYNIKKVNNVGKYFGECIGLMLEEYGVGNTITREQIIDLLGFEPLSPYDYLIIDCGTTAE